MPRPLVAIVGRPNVGKSTIFNALSRSRLAITDAEAGTTRDRILATVRRDGLVFDMVDTGGMGGEDLQGLDGSIESQIDLAVAEADLILMVTDIAAGRSPADDEVARRVRRSGKPVLLVANKADTAGAEKGLADFHALGMGDALAASARGRSRSTSTRRSEPRRRSIARTWWCCLSTRSRGRRLPTRASRAGASSRPSPPSSS